MSWAATGKVDFNYDIQPIISSKCFHCHGPDEKSRKAKLRLDLRDEALKERDGVRAIAPGNLNASELISRILSSDKDEVMPPPEEQHALSAHEIDLFKRWVKEGAEYKTHWSFVKPVIPFIPQVLSGKQNAAIRNPIDAFVAVRREQGDLVPNPEADRYVLLRRITLDLTGLPPTPAEVDAFTKDLSPDAYEKVIDRLLASPAYGERWAKMWLDLARYADSTGFGSDKFRLTIWPYRDWVIDAFNRNEPYDQFTIEQLAGDLLPNPTPEQIAATAFHRNTMTNVEGGTDDEEYRVAAIKDRVATTGQVWMGLTFGCAQCHTHKFDPISHRDYYSMFAIFNQTEDADREDEEPKMPILTRDEQQKRKTLQDEIAALETQMGAHSDALEAEQHEWEAQMSRAIPWTILKPVELSAAHSTLQADKNGVIEASGRQETGKDVYTIKAAAELRGITAIRLEALADSPLPNKGSERPVKGNVVISELRVALEPNQIKPPSARFLRIELPGNEQMLSLAEVQALSKGVNIARSGKASQSSTDFGGNAERAIDGNTDGDYFKANSVTHTRKEKNPWWEVDLKEEIDIEEIQVWNRTDGGSGPRLANFKVVLLDANRQPVWEQTIVPVPNPSAKVSPLGGHSIALQNPSASFNQAGFEVAKAIDGDPKSGWAFLPETGMAHAAVFETRTPLDASLEKSGSSLIFTISQEQGENHALKHFRLSATNATLPIRELPASILAILALEPSERTPAQRSEIAAYFLPLSKQFAALKAQIDAKKTDLANIKSTALPIMKERAASQRRKSFILNKGNFLLHGDEVTAALPAAFTGPSLPESMQGGEEINRLALARWLVSRDNPLTARVAVNRFWAQLFGTGIVESEEDFGTQGQLPSHPELLDWLAVTFMDSGWDIKALLKTITTSATYRQSSRTTPEHLQIDPRNRLLAHFPRRRLDAEGVRDQALMLSGLLSSKVGGPSVYPPQPAGLWQVAFNGGQNGYPTSTGEDRYRRGLYTFLRRTMPNPTMTAFDAPSREICIIRRVPTNTPLQAFVGLNDPVFVECAQALGRRLIREGGSDPVSRLRFGLQLCLARPADEKQMIALHDLLDQALTTYRADSEAAQKMATVPLGPLSCRTRCRRCCRMDRGGQCVAKPRWRPHEKLIDPPSRQ